VNAPCNLRRPCSSRTSTKYQFVSYWDFNASLHTSCFHNGTNSFRSLFLSSEGNGVPNYFQLDQLSPMKGGKMCTWTKLSLAFLLEVSTPRSFSFFFNRVVMVVVGERLMETRDTVRQSDIGNPHVTLGDLQLVTYST